MSNFLLLCLPFAGGNEYAYQKFKPFLPAHIEMLTPTLPGKGNRMGETQLRTIEQVVGEVFLQVKDRLLAPYAIYGHSLGAYVGHLLVHRLIKEKKSLPEHLFFSGKEAPSLHHDRRRY